MATVKKFDAVSRSTWARLKSADRSPIGAKPFAAERMDQNPLLVGRARGVDPDMAPMRLASTPIPETPPTNEALEGVFITLRIALDLSQILGDPDRVGKVLAEAVRIASLLASLAA